MAHCPFCHRIRLGEYDDRLGGVVTFEPLNPVTPGHRLFLPAVHTTWAEPASAQEAAACVRMAVRYMESENFNIITSCGPAATQTVHHIHIHLVPRREHDGLHLPWTGQGTL